jgi:hypothetical protein
MIEQIAHSSAEALRIGTTADVEAGIADLHVRQARHRRHTTLAAVAAVALALGLGWSAGWLMTRHGADESMTPVHPGPSQGQVVDHLCQAQRVTCLPDGSYRIALDRPLTYAPPPGFAVDSGGGATPVMFESYRQVGPTAGLTVLERVRAATQDGTGPARSVADDPQSFVSWVASRPYLDAGNVTRTTIDGHPAWRVRVVLSRHAGLGNAVCSIRYRCHALTYQRDAGTTGIWGTMASEYIAFRLPGGGTTVVWSWIFSGDTRHLGAIEEAVHSISWPTD